MKRMGHKLWAIPGGHIPLESHGREPEFTSYDLLCMLNTNDEVAHVSVTLYYSDREPVGPYELTVEARRVRHVRFNDLIDPAAMPLDVDYATVVEADVPFVVQFNRQDTRQAENAILGLLAFPG